MPSPPREATTPRASPSEAGHVNESLRQATELNHANKHTKALQILNNALQIQPNDARLQLAMALNLIRLGHYDEAQTLFALALRQQQEPALRANTLVGLGKLEEARHQYETALACYHIALECNPEHGEALLRLSSVSLSLGDLNTATQSAAAGLALNSNDHEHRAALAQAHVRAGRSEDARKLLTGRLMYHPSLAAVGSWVAENHESTNLSAASCVLALDHWLQQSLPQSEQSRLLFRRGRMRDQLGLFDDAFLDYIEGNRLQGVNFDSTIHTQGIDNIIRSFPGVNSTHKESKAKSKRTVQSDTQESQQAQFFGRQNPQNHATTPVFIVGMPRSGTTLVESILSAHSACMGYGELRDIPNIVSRLKQDGFYPGKVHDLPDALWQGAAHAYEKGRRTQYAGSNIAPRYWLDKMPINHQHLGIIAKIFPHAKVIHCQRHPLDTCLSCFTQLFDAGENYSYNLEHLGSYYRDYARIMEHWRRTSPLQLISVVYEELVNAPELHVRKLLEALQLSFEERCLRFFSTRRFSNTASFQQVRKPIYTSSVGKYKRVQQHLQPLIDALGV